MRTRQIPDAVSAACALLLLTAAAASGQGTFTYDQQSADESNYPTEGGVRIQENQPIGQSFTPMLPSVGFVRLAISDSTFQDTQSGILYVNLRADSITGTVLGVSQPVGLPAGFSGPVNFFFTTGVPVQPGTTYYFQPVVQTTNLWDAHLSSTYNYAGGTAFSHGSISPAFDFWFREGTFVPEPSSALLVFAGAAITLWRPSRCNPGRNAPRTSS